MPIARILSSRTALASAALLSIAMLAGCQSKPAGSGGADVAGAGEQDGTNQQQLSANPMPDIGNEMLRVGDRVHFELDRYELTPEAQATLRQQAGLLQTYPQVIVTIAGHADERGTREYNLALGERRADAVRNYLTALGVDPNRISVVSFGKERPECVAADESCWSQNRRGVTIASQ